MSANGAASGGDVVPPDTEELAPAPVTVDQINPRPQPYIHVTWITGLLADDEQCQLQPWAKAHFKYPRAERDLDDWKEKHGIAVRARVEELKAQGWTKITVENQNDIKIRGKSTVSGQPDIVAQRRTGSRFEILIIDLKTGKQRAKDRWQVRIYLVLYPYGRHVGPGTRLYGEVRYNDDEKLVEVTTDTKGRVLDQIRLTGGDARPEATPSGRECGRCDLPAALCSARVEGPIEGSALGVF